MSLFETKVEIPANAADAIDDIIQDLGVEGWSMLEDVIAQRAWIVGIFPGEAEARAGWAELAPLLPVAPLADPVRRVLADAEWRDSYKAHFHAWRFGRLHWVPVWERETFRLPPGDAVLWLDPGMAFGTGNHETTRLCVERLVALAEKFGVSGSGFRAGDPGRAKPETPNSKPGTPNSEPRLRVIDAGCGSGILALSAALLGFSEVSGFDNDPEAVRVSEENAALNGLAGKVRFRVGDLVSGFAGACGDVVLANILANVLIQYARELTAAVAPGGTLVLSGILAAEVEQVRAAFAAIVPDWPQASRTMGEWSDVELRRPE